MQHVHIKEKLVKSRERPTAPPLPPFPRHLRLRTDPQSYASQERLMPTTHGTKTSPLQNSTSPNPPESSSGVTPGPDFIMLPFFRDDCLRFQATSPKDVTDAVPLASVVSIRCHRATSPEAFSLLDADKPLAEVRAPVALRRRSRAARCPCVPLCGAWGVGRGTALRGLLAGQWTAGCGQFNSSPHP